MKLKTLALIAASSAMTLPAFAADPADPKAWDITATDTLFGTDITNTATFTYSVGTGTNKQDYTADSNIVEFQVDRKVIYNLTSSATGTVDISAGGTSDFTYTLTNDSNAPISFELPIPPENTTYTIRNIGETTGGIVITNGTLATSTDLIIELLKGDLAVSNNDQKEIIVTTTAPGSLVEGNTINPAFSIVAVEPSDSSEIGKSLAEKGVTKGDPIVAIDNAQGWVTSVIQTVTDPALIDSGEIKITGTQLFEVKSAIISLQKSVRIISDPINLTVNPKAIPGAVIEYALTVSNTGSLSATVELTDLLNERFTLTDTISSLKINTNSYAGSSPITIASEASTTEDDSLLTIPEVTVGAYIPTSDTSYVKETTVVTFEVVLK